jgi:hypothetical protein
LWEGAAGGDGRGAAGGPRRGGDASDCVSDGSSEGAKEDREAGSTEAGKERPDTNRRKRKKKKE